MYKMGQKNHDVNQTSWLYFTIFFCKMQSLFYWDKSSCQSLE